MSFDRWLLTIDGLCQMDYGLSIYDLPDLCFRDAYDSGQTPTEFMDEFLPDVAALGDLILS